MKEVLQKLGLLTIGQYRFVRKLSGGKMAHSTIYVNNRNRFVVIKFLFMPKNDNEYFYFKNEAETLSRLSRTAYYKYSPLVIKGLTKVKPYPIYYFIMEYIGGETLHEYIGKNPLPWSEKKAIEILIRIALAVTPANALAVIHRKMEMGSNLYS